MLKYYNYDIVFQEIPNEVTLAINISNCPNRCKGCHSPHLQLDVGHLLDEEMLVALVGKYAKAFTCLCFMGGDAAPLEVTALANFVRLKFPMLKTAWYSGCNKLPEGFGTSAFHFIKMGAYSEALGGLKSSTSNQHLYEIQPNGDMKDISYLFVEA
jgi:anaerobic ribonucleoside-triphosphate reductase activating protein